MSVKIHGKDYKTVAERVVEAHQKHKESLSITTQIVELLTKDNVICVGALVKIGNQQFTGMASETIGSTMINKTSALENAETSAIGRALAAAGFIGSEYASADEVANAITNQKSAQQPQGQVKDNINQPTSKPATEKQVNAIKVIAKKFGVDASYAVHEKFGKDKVEELTSKEASSLIEWMQNG